MTSPISQLMKQIIRYKIKNHLKRIVEKPQTEDIFYVTDLFRCSYKRIFNIEFPEIVSFSNHTIFGDIVHEGIQSILMKAQNEIEGVNVEVEKPLEFVVELGNNKKILLKGKVDVILNEIPYEIKTVKILEHTPYKDHIKQIATYMLLLNKNIGYLVYISNGDVIEYLIELYKDEESFKQAYETINCDKPLEKILNDLVPIAKDINSNRIIILMNEDILKKLIIATLNTNRKPEFYECIYCPYRNFCPYKIK